MPNKTDIENFVTESVEEWADQLTLVSKLIKDKNFGVAEALIADCCEAMILNIRHIADLRVEAVIAELRVEAVEAVEARIEVCGIGEGGNYEGPS